MVLILRQVLVEVGVRGGNANQNTMFRVGMATRNTNKRWPRPQHEPAETFYAVGAVPAQMAPSTGTIVSAVIILHQEKTL